MSPQQVPGWDDYFLGIATAVSARAKCTRRRVGAVLTIDHRIIATGYNGAAPGEDDCLMGACPRGQLSYDDVPGLGPARRKALLKHFGSVRKLTAASVEEIAAVPGIGPRLAATVSAALGSNQAPGTNQAGEPNES